MASLRSNHIVSAEELRDELLHGGVIVLDIRISAHGRGGRDLYLNGHIPGALFVDLDVDLCGTATAQSGDRPLPETDSLTESLRRWGITPESSVVVYDDSRSAPAGRAWWILRWAGLSRVRLLDGGLTAWTDAGERLATGEEQAPRGTIIARPGQLQIISTSRIPAVSRNGVLLDARPPELYGGVSEGGGHIPGAVSASVFDDLDHTGKLREESVLRARYETLGVIAGGTSAVTYCGSAVAAALQVLVLSTIGVEAALYVGSFSQWTADPRCPIPRAGGPTLPSTFTRLT